MGLFVLSDGCSLRAAARFLRAAARSLAEMVCFGNCFGNVFRKSFRVSVRCFGNRFGFWFSVSEIVSEWGLSNCPATAEYPGFSADRSDCAILVIQSWPRRGCGRAQGPLSPGGMAGGAGGLKAVWPLRHCWGGGPLRGPSLEQLISRGFRSHFGSSAPCPAASAAQRPRRPGLLGALHGGQNPHHHIEVHIQRGNGEGQVGLEESVQAFCLQMVPRERH